ncbi:ABC-type transport system, involved in lipoprotein release, permease component [Clostridium sp. DSM 8431]|uniref:ABC transporter permease n=1 Tax=Clostridium sp. DSM 8431 TaxID=1761781 RepID=UPI0008F011D4|nr:FtsX-like permease family protein [Clostridium sp. DSM 8431]SFU34615.1 ABC-type transport system, involved in lipoprotein release, permease component [Clostridium sp. DSM 8431]
MRKILNGIYKSRSGKDKKLSLCYITVIITSFIIFTALNALPVLKASIAQDLRQTTVGLSDLIITNDKDKIFEVPENKNSNMLGVLSLSGEIEGGKKKTNFTLWGSKYSEFVHVFGEVNLGKGDVKFPKDLGENDLMITPSLAEKIGAKEGDTVAITVLSSVKSYNVVLAPKENYFVKANEDMAILNYETAKKLVGLDTDKVTVAYGYNLKDGVNVRDEIQDLNKDLTIKDSIDKEYVSGNMQQYYAVDAVIFVFILLIAIDILKSIGLIFVTERSKYIGTLRSNGAEKKLVINLFCKLAIRISIIGMIIGMILGTISILIFSKYGVGLSNPLNSIDLVFMVISILTTSLITLALTIESFRRPTVKILKKSDRALLIENTSADIKREKVSKLSYVCLAAIPFLIIAAYFIKANNIALILIYTVILIFSLIKGFKALMHILIDLFLKKPKKGLTVMAMKNVATNIYLRKTLTLATVICLFVTIVGTLSYSVLSAMTSFYKDYKSDAFVRTTDNMMLLDEEIKAITSLDSVLSYYKCSVSNIEIKGDSEDREVKVVGIDDVKEFDNNFMNLHLTWANDSDEESFKSGENVILSQVLSNRFDKKVGEYITLSDGDITKDYYIAGVCQSLQDLGDMIYMQRAESEFSKVKDYNTIYLKGENPSEIEEDIDEILLNRKYVFKDVSNMQEKDVTNGMQIIIFFVAFSIIITLTSITGIYSNYKLSYMLRKKEFAILMSNGYSRSHLTKLFIKEILFSSLIGYGMGVIVMVGIKKPLENLMEIADLPIEINIKIEIFMALLIIMIFVALLNIILACKSANLKKDKIVEILKM